MKEKEIILATEWKELSFRQYYELYNAIRSLESIKEDANSRSLVYVARAIAAVTKLDFDYVWKKIPNETVQMIWEKMNSEDGILAKEHPTGKLAKFTFRDLTAEEYKERKSQLANRSLWKKASDLVNAKNDLQIDMNVTFYIHNTKEQKDLKNDPFEQWILSESLLERITHLESKIAGGSFELLPKLLAYIARPKGERIHVNINDKDNVTVDFGLIKRREEIFWDLPCTTVIQARNFFFTTDNGCTTASTVYGAVFTRLAKKINHIGKSISESGVGTP